ncbi:hypothetical protein M514_00199 [Trichuris suis]|uniref:ATP-dependent RNA helicase SUV3 homolog, mitochondrial n=1 Tax=Trichuris suis TaxID=68888 RepID=A0A085MP90_9BILA|nr:hypothetical protein M513_00199 [Trichuris suis]KFD73071.1 hypothetical protein M514_00199 [Trichuris suis]
MAAVRDTRTYFGDVGQGVRHRMVIFGMPIFKLLVETHCLLITRRLISKKSFEDVVMPVAVQSSSAANDVGADFGGELTKQGIAEVLGQFASRTIIRKLSAEYGLGGKFFQQAMASFRRFCQDSAVLPVDLHLTISDILQSSRHVDDLFPLFLKHARQVFPHLECLEELQKISDLRLPQHWYPEARSLQRRFIFHAGPTNSGKTHQALTCFMSAQTGVYCGPLKLLATEVYHRCNNAGVSCDLITGDERCYGNGHSAGDHISCTVEMLDTRTHYHVAVIDEIQMLRDLQRGWAWTRALLGVHADEVHLCGEPAAVELVKELLQPIDENVDVRIYERMTPLEVMSEPIHSVSAVQPGDCIVAFNKNDVFRIAKQVEAEGHNVAMIYGSLPPGTKLAQAQKFNDPDDPCDVLVATDAIGMGLNLSIKRVIFNSLVKVSLNEAGDKELEPITTSQALQIAGRAGRYGTCHSHGQVTTIRAEDLSLLKSLLSRQPEPINKAGLFPTLEQIELFSYYLPKATLSNLLDIFVSLSALDEDHFFMCNIDDLKFLADMIEHVPLALRVRYLFCLAPISRKKPFVCGMFLRYARKFSRGEPLTAEWVQVTLGWPLSVPSKVSDLMHLEDVFDVLDAYLWLGYRFVDMFPDMAQIRAMQLELDVTIRESLEHMKMLSSKVAETHYSADRRYIAKTHEQVGTQGASVIESLIRQGLLTPKIVEDIRKEIRNEGHVSKKTTHSKGRSRK